MWLRKMKCKHDPPFGYRKLADRRLSSCFLGRLCIFCRCQSSLPNSRWCSCMVTSYHRCKCEELRFHTKWPITHFECCFDTSISFKSEPNMDHLQGIFPPSKLSCLYQASNFQRMLGVLRILSLYQVRLFLSLKIQNK
jgi:hypothetical protein